MDTSVRAHRILAGLSNYHGVKQVDHWSSPECGQGLGKPIGIYRNPGPQGAVVEIFAEGLSWLDNGRAMSVRFTEIVEVSLPSGKESEGLLLTLQRRAQLLLPVEGRSAALSTRWRCLDSWSVCSAINAININPQMNRTSQQTDATQHAIEPPP